MSTFTDEDMGPPGFVKKELVATLEDPICPNIYKIYKNNHESDHECESTFVISTI
jgi:hypothetical protein